MTRAALLTPPGPAGVAVLKIVGPRALATAELLFRPATSIPPTSFCDVSPERLHLGGIYDNDELIDQVILAIDPSTDSVEINAHGGPRVVQRLLMLLSQRGMEITSWQQLEPADSVAAELSLTLPRAKTPLAAKAIAAQYPTGLTEWITKRLNNAALHEPDANDRLTTVQHELTELCNTYLLAQRLLNGTTVALAGTTNVGKSTLANALTGRQQSLVADVAGTTRDWTMQLTDIEGIPAYLIDTAGNRISSDQLEHESIVRTTEQLKQADLVVLVLEPDHRGRIDPNYSAATAHLPRHITPLLVVNKTDVFSDAPCHNDCISVSALHARNLDALRRAIADRLGFTGFDPRAPLVFTSRQHNLLRAASTCNTPSQIKEHLQQLLGCR